MEDIHPPTHAGIKGKAAQRAPVHTEVQVATQLAPPKFFGSRGMGRERPFAGAIKPMRRESARSIGMDAGIFLVAKKRKKAMKVQRARVSESLLGTTKHRVKRYPKETKTVCFFFLYTTERSTFLYFNLKGVFAGGVSFSNGIPQIYVEVLLR
jgi:hypothetical protein